MVELADTPDLGSGGRPCRFKSCYPHDKAGGRLAACFVMRIETLNLGSRSPLRFGRCKTEVPRTSCTLLSARKSRRPFGRLLQLSDYLRFNEASQPGMSAVVQ